MAKQQKSKRQLGDFGEQLALQYLELKGLRYIESNWSCRLGEVDLVMQDDDTRVFVEVRLRREGDYGSAADSVGFQKQGRLKKAVAAYQKERGYWGDVRIDVISITTGAGEAAIEHIEWAVEE